MILWNVLYVSLVSQLKIEGMKLNLIRTGMKKIVSLPLNASSLSSIIMSWATLHSLDHFQASFTPSHTSFSLQYFPPSFIHSFIHFREGMKSIFFSFLSNSKPETGIFLVAQFLYSRLTSSALHSFSFRLFIGSDRSAKIDVYEVYGGE